MAITVATWGREPSTYDDLAVGREVVLFDPRAERGTVPVGDRYRRLDEGFGDADLLVIRGSTLDLRGLVEEDSLLPDLVGSMPTQILVRSRAADHLDPTLLPVSWAEPGELEPPLQELRQAELRAILERTAAIFSDDGIHYALPSGVHADRFVRLSDAMCDMLDVHRIADWLLGSLTADTALLADTGTILLVLHEVQSYCREYFDWRIPIDALPEYPSNAAVVEEAVNSLRALPGVRRVLFVLSVGSSGATAGRFRAVATGEDDMVAVCETAPNRGRARSCTGSALGSECPGEM